MNRLLLGRRLFSIQAKIILPYLVLVFFLLAAVGYIGSQIIFDSIRERFTNQLIEAGKLATYGIVRQENEMLESLRLLAFTQGVPEAISSGDVAALRLIALPIAINARQDMIIFLDPEGEVVLGLMHDPDGNVAAYKYIFTGNEMQSWAIVQSVLEGQSDEHGDKFAGFESTSFGNYFLIAGPIRDANGNLAGVVIVGQPAENLADMLRQETLAQITLYGPDGIVVATTFTELPLLDASNSQQIINDQAQSSLIRDMTQSDITYSEVLGAWKARGDNLGVIGIAFAQNFLIRFSQQRWILLLISTTSALLLVFAVGVFISKNISEPIQRLEKAALQVAAGDLEVQVHPSGRDEVTALTREFNDMVQNMRQSRQDLVAAYESTIEAWAKTLEIYDIETLGHSQRVTELTLALARSLGMSKEDLVQIRRGALLHDIGKLTIPVNILRKNGPLSPDEQALVRLHPGAAYEILKDIPFLSKALDIPYCHHERWDGGGYPRGLKGEEIPLVARLFTVVDVWDALKSDRPYRKAMTRQEAVEILRQGSESLFDPHAVNALLKII